MQIAATMFLEDPAQRRSADRMPIDASATVRPASAEPIDVVVRDLSTDGCLIETRARLDEGSTIRLGIAGVPVSEARIVRRSGQDYGCRFVRPLREADVAMAGRIETVHRGLFAEPERRRFPVLDRVTAGLQLSLVGSVWLTVVATPVVVGGAIMYGAASLITRVTAI